ncbi:hypothetical protein [Cognatishimia sp.]|uniref:hypothetical protein n=1 Tax=Cognatishimia sp. TaxID=2211648 RepID=UPI003519C721|nr:hypothetical protein [Cognatishimia sp.]
MNEKSVTEMSLMIPLDITAKIFHMERRYLLEKARKKECTYIPQPRVDVPHFIRFGTKDIADALGLEVGEVAEFAAALAA